MTAAHPYKVVVTTVGEQLSTFSGFDSKDLAKPKHYINIQCSGFFIYTIDTLYSGRARFLGV